MWRIPITVGPLDLTDYYFEHKTSQLAAYDKVPAVIQQVSDEFGDLTGRHYDFAEEYKMDDAEMVMVMLGSSAGTAKDVIDEYREKGVKVGLLKLRTFRPFPVDYIAEKLAGRKAVCVLDRSASFGGQGGPVFMESPLGHVRPAGARARLHLRAGRPRFRSAVRSATVIEDLQKVAAGGKIKDINLLGIRS